jgi:hypothetical protein
MAELTRRYIVMQMATEGPFDAKDPDASFVLKPWKDPAALKALEAYRDHCYPELAAELSAWIAAIASGAAIRGGVGARNEAHLVSVTAPPPDRGGTQAPRSAHRIARATAARTRAIGKRRRPARKKRRRRS